jgi:hypothetical protein
MVGSLVDSLGGFTKSKKTGTAVGFNRPDKINFNLKGFALIRDIYEEEVLPALAYSRGEGIFLEIWEGGDSINLTHFIEGNYTTRELTKALKGNLIKPVQNKAFSLTDSQQNKLDDWIMANNPEAYTGAIGGRYQYIFGTTSLGMTVRCLDTLTNKEIDLTEYEYW